MIQVEPISSHTFRVTIDKGVTTTHEVHLEEETALQLGDGAIEPKEIVEAAIEYLLEHESNTSILRNFHIKDIGTYFPGYQEEIKEKLGTA